MPINIGRNATININRGGTVRMVSDLGTNQPTGRIWYVSSTYTGSTSNGNFATPWKTISNVRTAAANGTIQPGDTIAFKRGEVFITPSFGFQWFGARRTATSPLVSGQPGKPITFTNYGDPSESLPNILHPGTGGETRNRKIMIFSGVDYMIIDGIGFVDFRENGAPSKIVGVRCGMAIDLGDSSAQDSPEDQCNNCIIRNCIVNSIGYGFVVCGNDNLVENNILENFGQSYPFTPDSFGSVGIELNGSKRNQVLRNTIKGGWSWAEVFSWNGGGIELINGNEDHLIAYNTIVDCAGAFELGQNTAGSIINNVTFAYNKVINCGGMTFANVGGSAFAVDAKDVFIYNNVLIENNISRYSGTNFASGAADFPTFQPTSCPKWPDPAERCIRHSSVSSTDPSANIPLFLIKNNLFILQSAPIVFTDNVAPCTNTRLYTLSVGPAQTSNAGRRSVWSNNIYQLTNGSIIGHPLYTNEIQTATQVLTNTSNPNPELWNYTPSVGSQLIGNGIDVGLTQDFNGNPVTGTPTIGILQN